MLVNEEQRRQYVESGLGLVHRTSRSGDCVEQLAESGCRANEVIGDLWLRCRTRITKVPEGPLARTPDVSEAVALVALLIGGLVLVERASQVACQRRRISMMTVARSAAF